MWAFLFTFHLTCYFDDQFFAIALSSSNSLFRRTIFRYCFIIFWTRFFRRTNLRYSFIIIFLNSLFRRTNLRYCFIIFLNSLFRRTNLRYCFIIFLNLLFRRTNLRYCFIIFQTRYFDKRTFATAYHLFKLVISTDGLSYFNGRTFLFQQISMTWMHNKACDQLHAIQKYWNWGCGQSHAIINSGVCGGVRVRSHASPDKACNKYLFASFSCVFVWIQCHFDIFQILLQLQLINAKKDTVNLSVTEREDIHEKGSSQRSSLRQIALK